MVGTPAEVALIRMTSDMKRPPAERRNYKHVFNALSRIYGEEGLLKMWSGCTPTVARAVVLNAAQLSVYSQAKEWIIGKNPEWGAGDLKTHFSAVSIWLIITIISKIIFGSS